MLTRKMWLGVGLIVVGAVMLLHRLYIIPFDWHTAFWFLVALLGATMAVRGFSKDEQHRGSVFWGTVLFLFGGYRVLVDSDLIWVPSYIRVSLLVLMVGVAFLVLYVSMPKNWSLLVPTVVFLGLGSLMLASSLGYIDRWMILDMFRSYWPIILILFGISLLLTRKSPDGKTGQPG